MTQGQRGHGVRRNRGVTKPNTDSRFEALRDLVEDGDECALGDLWLEFSDVMARGAA